MGENKVTKISLSTFLLILSLIVIIVMGIFMYKFYNEKTEATKKSAELQTQSEILKDEINNNKIETLDIKSDKIKKLYNYVSKFSYYDELIAYQSKKVTEKDLANSLKLLTIFNNLDKDDATRIEYKYENEYIPKREHVIYSKKIIDDKATEIFGNNVTIIHEDASPYDGHSIIYKNNEYDSFDYEGGGAVPWESSVNILISAEKDYDGTIYIYDKYIHITDDSFYTSSDKQYLLISNFDYNKQEKNNFYEGLENIGAGSEEWIKIYIQNIEKYLGKELTKYKHTYKQNQDGEYYWYSTEPIQ